MPPTASAAFGQSRRHDAYLSMKLLFDQNLSHKLVVQLAAEFPGSAHVRDCGLSRAPDPELWSYAAAQGFVIVSKDVDFQQRSPDRTPFQSSVDSARQLRDRSRGSTAPLPPGNAPRI